MAMGHTLIKYYCLWPLIWILCIYSTCSDDQYFIFTLECVINLYTGNHLWFNITHLKFPWSKIKNIFVHPDICSRPTCLNSTIYILVYVILSVSHVADLLHCLYILSHPGGGLIRVYSILNCCDTYICEKIQIVACTCKCTVANFGSFVLVWCFK